MCSGLTWASYAAGSVAAPWKWPMPRGEVEARTLALRVTVTEAVDLTIVRVDGRLTDDGAAELDGTAGGRAAPWCST